MSEKNSSIAEKKQIIHIDKDLYIQFAECVIDCLGGPEKIISAEIGSDIEFFYEGLGGCTEKCPEGAISSE